jgi:DNA-binding GntR family transcriptional regulator
MAGARGSLPMHRELLDAVIAGDPLRAGDAAATLIESARGDIEYTIGQGPIVAAEVCA